MNKYKKLKIRGSLLDRGQLSKHIEKLASNHNIRSNSKKDESIPVTERRLSIDTKISSSDETRNTAKTITQQS